MRFGRGNGGNVISGNWIVGEAGPERLSMPNGGMVMAHDSLPFDPAEPEVKPALHDVSADPPTDAMLPIESYGQCDHGVSFFENCGECEAGEADAQLAR